MSTTVTSPSHISTNRQLEVQEKAKSSKKEEAHHSHAAKPHEAASTPGATPSKVSPGPTSPFGD